MAAQAWQFYDSFKRYMADGTLDLDGTNFRISLYKSTSNAISALATITVVGSVSNQLPDGNGYSTSGKALTQTWSTGASAGEMRFDATAVVWTASGGAIGSGSGIQFAVIWASGASAGARKLVCACSLSSAAFTITNGNTLTITPNATNGIFELN